MKKLIIITSYDKKYKVSRLNVNALKYEIKPMYSLRVFLAYSTLLYIECHICNYLYYVVKSIKEYNVNAN